MSTDACAEGSPGQHQPARWRSHIGSDALATASAAGGGRSRHPKRRQSPPSPPPPPGTDDDTTGSTVAVSGPNYRVLSASPDSNKRSHIHRRPRRSDKRESMPSPHACSMADQAPASEWALVSAGAAPTDTVVRSISSSATSATTIGRPGRPGPMTPTLSEADDASFEPAKPPSSSDATSAHALAQVRQYLSADAANMACDKPPRQPSLRRHGSTDTGPETSRPASPASPASPVSPEWQLTQQTLNRVAPELKPRDVWTMVAMPPEAAAEAAMATMTTAIAPASQQQHHPPRTSRGSRRCPRNSRPPPLLPRPQHHPHGQHAFAAQAYVPPHPPPVGSSHDRGLTPASTSSPLPAPAPASPAPTAVPAHAPAPASVPSPQNRVPLTPQSTASSTISTATGDASMHDLPPKYNPAYPEILLQPETRPIAPTQLISEVKGIYVGLVMVETKTIEIDAAQRAAAPGVPLNDEQWLALVSLHRTLMHEHHDFLLASQHPSATAALRRVALKYAMAARLWRHGIHGFLELLRYRLPQSREHMETFIYMAYSILALLYETVPGFDDTWIECLGDISRYRMAIEEESQYTRDVWTGVSRRWYMLASDRSPATGRLFHHLGILARPRIVAQFFFYAKALCTSIPFAATRESILTLLEPALAGTNMPDVVTPADHAFTCCHALHFMHANQTGSAYVAGAPRPPAAFEDYAKELLGGLDAHIHHQSRNWIAAGAQMAIVNCCASLQYGAEANPLVRLLRDAAALAHERPHRDRDADSADVVMPDAGGSVALDPALVAALAPMHALIGAMDRIVFARHSDPNCYGYIHVRMAMLTTLAELPGALAYLEHDIAWDALCRALNQMLLTRAAYEGIEAFYNRIEADEIMESPPELPPPSTPDCPTPAPTTTTPNPPPRRTTKPLPEDWALRALLFADRLFVPRAGSR